MKFILFLVLGMLLTSVRGPGASFRYFYDDANELYRVLDSTGTLIEYTYDPSGNITNVARTSVLPIQLSIFNVSPANAIGGSTLTILGQNFSTVAAGDVVMIGGVAATVISASAMQLVVQVPLNTFGGAISVTVGGVTVSWSNNVSVVQPPSITSVTPSSGKNGTTVTVSVGGQSMSGATFTISSVDPSFTAAPAALTLVSNTGTMATLTLALGTTEGEFALVATNSIGTSAITPGSLFLIGPVNNAVSSYLSVLNTGFNPTTNPLLPAGQNSVSFLASVLNISDNTTSNPPFPPGHNAVSFYTSVLNTATSGPTLPTGQNNVSFYASVLNTSDNTTTNPPFPTGKNALSSYASVLNTGFNPATNPLLPAGQNTAAGLGISVCNTKSGCTATAPAKVSANGAADSTRPRLLAPLPGGQTSLPVLGSFANDASATAGQTILLTASNVNPGSVVDFEVNRATVARIGQPPYETLFTVPEGTAELAFQLVVRSAGGQERLSEITRIAVAADAGADISGNIAQGIAGVELGLAAGGLRAEFFPVPQPVTGLPALNALKPVRSGYVTAINEPNPGSVFGDDPLGARLGSDYAVRFSGEVRADAAGLYRFWLTARSGAALWIDGKQLADSGFVTGQPAEAEVSLALDAGWHRLEVIYYEAVGASSVRLEWQRPGGERREVLGPQHLRTELAGISAVSSADGTFAFRHVPKRFDTVWIRVRQGDNYTEYPAVQPGASHVSLAVEK